MQWAGNVLYRCSMHQCADLTYIVANGSFRIWLISRSYKDEIMYEIMFHVLQSWRWLAHILVELLSGLAAHVCADALDWCHTDDPDEFKCSCCLLSKWSSPWAGETRLSGCDQVGWRLWQTSCWAPTWCHVVWHWLKMSGLAPVRTTWSRS